MKCLDCEVPVIGGRARCPACHDRLAATRRRSNALGRALIVSLVGVEVLAVVTCVLVLAWRGC